MIKFPKANNGSTFSAGNIQTQPKKRNTNQSLVSISPLSKDDDTRPKIDPTIRSKTSNKRQTTEFEELSNVSEERPEIISLSSFDPLYDEFGNKTENGKLFDVYIESLRQIDATTQKLFSEIEDKDFLKSKNNTFKVEIAGLREKLSNLNSLLRTLNLASNNLNLHNKIYDFSPIEFVEKSFDDSTSRKTKKSDLLTIVNKLPDNLNLDNSLMDVMGLPQNSSSKYCSTKLWLLALRELRTLLFSHSRNLLPASVKSNNDESTSYLQIDNSLRLSLPAFQSSIGDVNTKVTGTSIFKNDEQPSAGTSQSAKDVIKNVSVAMSKIDALLKIIKDDEAKIALIFDLITKELRYSTCFDEDSQSLKTFRGPGTQQITSKNFFDSVFGNYVGGFDIFQKSPDFATVNLSVSDLCYTRDASNQDRGILTLEEKEQINISNELSVGSKYFFDPETIFTNIIGLRLNLSRVENLQKSLNRLDNNLFDIMSNFGMLPVDDSVFELSIRFPNEQNSSFQPHKPSILSSNPVKFIENVTSLMVGADGLSKIHRSAKPENNKSILNLKQEERGISSIFSIATQENDFGRNVRSCLFLIIEDMVGFSTNKVLDNNLFETLKSSNFQTSVDVKNAITKDKVESANFLNQTFINAFNKNFDDSVTSGQLSHDDRVDTGRFSAEDELKKSFKGLYENFKNGEQGALKYIPCKYDDAETFSNAVRNSPFVLDIVKIVRELKSIFTLYAAKGQNYTAFQNINLENIYMIFFTALCKMASQFSDNTIVSLSKNDNSLDNDTASNLGKISNVGDVFSIKLGYDRSLAEANELRQKFLDHLGFKKYELVLYVNNDNVSKTYKQKEISSYAQHELVSLLKISTSILNTLDILNSNVKSIDSAVKKFNSDSIAYILKYLNNDPRKLSLILKEPQLLLLLSSVEDVYQSFNDFNDDDKQQGEDNNLFTNYVQNTFYYPKMTEIYDLLFKDNDEYTTKKGYNKKILTIGIPQGMFDRLLKKSSLNSKNSKHNDIFKISVFKIDILNGDIIYRPKVFLFEASRFPARIYSEIKKTRNSDYREIFKAIPTRNYSLSVDGSSYDLGNPVYWDDKSNVFGNEYSFLTEDEKNQVIENHVLSYVLENYMKVITGMTLNDLTFNLDSREIESLVTLIHDVDVVKRLSDARDLLSAKADKAELNSRKLQIASKSIGSSLGLGGKNLSKLQIKPVAIEKQTTNNLMRLQIDSKKPSLNLSKIVKTAQSLILSPDPYITKFINPKKFDRVFNVIFDPEFEVNYEKTTATTTGAEKLKMLIRQGSIIQKRPEVNEYVDADKSSLDLSLESFFVVVETHAEQFVLPIQSRGLTAQNQALQSNSFTASNIKNSLTDKNVKNQYRK
jgi:hypothetical protein